MGLSFDLRRGEVEAFPIDFRKHSFCIAVQREKGAGDITTLDCV